MPFFYAFRNQFIADNETIGECSFLIQERVRYRRGTLLRHPVWQRRQEWPGERPASRTTEWFETKLAIESLHFSLNDFGNPFFFRKARALSSFFLKKGSWL